MQITPIENELRMEGQQPCPHWNWLNNSYGAGQEFWQSFKNAADEMFSVKTTSTLFKRYNLKLFEVFTKTHYDFNWCFNLCIL